MSTEPIKEVFLFDPLSIPGCCLWLDAADRTVLFSDSAGTLPVSTGSQRLSYWKDKSTSNNHATNTTSTPTVTFQSLNSYPTVSFEGSNYLTLTSTSLPNGGTNASYFFVCRTTNTGVYVFFSHGPTPTQQAQTPQFFFNSGQIYADTFGSNAIYDNSTQTNNYLTLSFTRSTTLSGWLHGSSFIGSNNSPLSVNTGTGFATLGVGRVSANLDYYYRGNMAELIVYNTNLTTTNRQLIEGYLANKWGLNPRLPSDHPYLTYRPLLSNLPLPLVPSNPLRAINSGTPPYSGFPTVITQAYFTPKSYSDLALWLDGADFSSIVQSGNSITQWNDKSGNSRNATNVGTIQLTSYNKGNIVNFGGNQMKVTSFPWRTKFITFMVVKSINGNFLYSTKNSGSAYVTYIYTGNWNLFLLDGTTGGNDSVIAQGTPVMPTNQLNLVVMGYNNGAALTPYKINGTTRTSQTITPVGDVTRTWDLYMNGNSTASFDTSQVAEIIHYNNNTLTAANIEKIEGYLAWKWGIANLLPSSHPFKNIPPQP